MESKKKLNKILHIITGLNIGGAEIFLDNLVSKDYKYSHEIISLTGIGDLGIQLRKKNVKVYDLHFSKNIFNLISQIYKLFFLIKKSKPEIIHLWMYHTFILGTLFAYMLNIKRIIWSIRASYIYQQFTFINNIIIYLTLIFSKIFRRPIIVYNSNYSCKTHKQLGFNNTSKIIFNGVNTNYFTIDEKKKINFKKKYNLNSEEAIVGMIARYDKDKDHETLFKALKISSKKINYTCILAGSGINNHNSNLNILIKRHSLGNKILLLDLYDNIPELMNSLDLHILSSKTESFPNVIVESMSCGTPCIASDVGDVKLILNGCGWIFPKEDYIQLSKLIVNFIMKEYNTNNIKNIRKINRERIINYFNLDISIKNYVSLWDELISY